MAPMSPHAIGEQARVLGKIAYPTVNLSLWRRPAQAAIVGEVSKLQASQLRDVRRPTTIRTFDHDVSVLLRQQGLDPSVFENWRADLRRLANLFAGVSEGRNLQFRLLTTDRDDCRRFHLDRTHLRLLCTYRGPGTEWLTDSQVDREAQARGAPNESIIRFGQASRFEPFWVGIMRGDPGNIGNGLVHRSPPITGSGEIRVLFCLDC
ncbi:MAG: DUF1826 domain-containing protein [Pseudomonadales bacterium]|nr:DUF1826 domain-containing protein [Pseudomonadales bacterium]